MKKQIRVTYLNTLKKLIFMYRIKLKNKNKKNYCLFRVSFCNSNNKINMFYVLFFHAKHTNLLKTFYNIQTDNVKLHLNTKLC